MEVDSAGEAQDRYLVDQLERFVRMDEPGRAVQVHLSRLLPVNRKPTHVRVVARMFEPLITGLQAWVYTLSNGDILLIGRGVPEDDLATVVRRVRALFDDDPAAYGGDGTGGSGGEDAFVTWFDLPLQTQELRSAARRILSEGLARRRAPQLSMMERPEPLDPNRLGLLLEALSSFDIAPFLGSQPAVRLDRALRADVLFVEHFVRIADLKAAVAPNVDLFADRWLFQNLSRALDRRVMAAMPRRSVDQRVRGISLNLNLETVQSDTFGRFLGLMASRGPKRFIMVEVQLIDVFNNIGRYQAVREALHRAGHRILIDSLTASTLELIDVAALQPDHAKLLWTPDLGVSSDSARDLAARKLSHALGPDGLVLARCESHDGFAWGLQRGLQVFQGNYIDALLQSAAAKART